MAPATGVADPAPATIPDHAARMAADARRLLDALRRAGLDCKPGCTCRGDGAPDSTDRLQTAD